LAANLRKGLGVKIGKTEWEDMGICFLIGVSLQRDVEMDVNADRRLTRHFELIGSPSSLPLWDYSLPPSDSLSTPAHQHTQLALALMSTDP